MDLRTIDRYSGEPCTLVLSATKYRTCQMHDIAYVIAQQDNVYNPRYTLIVLDLQLDSWRRWYLLRPQGNNSPNPWPAYSTAHYAAVWHEYWFISAVVYSVYGVRRFYQLHWTQGLVFSGAITWRLLSLLVFTLDNDSGSVCIYKDITSSSRVVYNKTPPICLTILYEMCVDFKIPIIESYINIQIDASVREGVLTKTIFGQEVVLISHAHKLYQQRCIRHTNKGMWC